MKVNNLILGMEGKQIKGFLCFCWDEDGIMSIGNIGQLHAYFGKKEYIEAIYDLVHPAIKSPSEEELSF